MNNLIELKKIIAEAENIVFLGGAGVSTDSGIPDFRGNGGLYTEEYESTESPEVILSKAYFYEYPRSFYNYYRKHMIHPYAHPNDAHFALAELESGKDISEGALYFEASSKKNWHKENRTFLFENYGQRFYK